MTFHEVSNISEAPIPATAAMTIRAAKFTPEVLLSAPRRSGGAPNSDASKILYALSTYSFAEHETKKEIRILDVEKQQSSLVTDDKSYSEPTWLDDETVLLLKSNDDGTTDLVVGSPKKFEQRYAFPLVRSKFHSLTRR